MNEDGTAQPDAAASRRLAEAGRQALREIWTERDDKERMPPPARRLLELLEAHKEYRPFWEGADPEAGENPFLHVYYHQALDKQIEADDPPEAGAALERLVGQGLPLHEAQHKMMAIWVREMADMVARRGPFNTERYRQRLDDLGR